MKKRSFRELLRKPRVILSRKRTRCRRLISQPMLNFAQVLRASLELGQVKQEIDKRIAEKEEEFENTRSDLYR